MINRPIRGALWVLGLAAAAVALALIGRYGNAFVVFVVPPWRLEMSMMLFCIVAVGGFLLVYGLLRAGEKAWHLPRARAARKRDHEQSQSRDAVFAGLKSLFSGRFRDAERHARDAMGAASAPAETRDLAAALAAWAAHEYGSADAALPYLERIRDARSAEMRDVSRAYMLLSDGRAKEALEILRSLAQANPGNAGVLKMKVEAEVADKSWEDVLATLNALTKTGLMPEAAAQQIRLTAELNLMRTRTGGRDAVLAEWKALSNDSRYDVAMVVAVAKRLIALGCGDDAREVLENAIDERGPSKWDSGLVAIYAECKGDSTLGQIERAEKWLKTHARDPVLLATLGKLCMRQGLWGKAQSYLEASVALLPSLDAHMTLARLMEQIGRRDDAIRHIRRSAELAKDL
jgi:HemY protein